MLLRRGGVVRRSRAGLISRRATDACDRRSTRRHARGRGGGAGVPPRLLDGRRVLRRAAAAHARARRPHFAADPLLNERELGAAAADCEPGAFTQPVVM